MDMSVLFCFFYQGNCIFSLLVYQVPQLPMEWCTKWWTPPGMRCSSWPGDGAVSPGGDGVDVMVWVGCVMVWM